MLLIDLILDTIPVLCLLDDLANAAIVAASKVGAHSNFEIKKLDTIIDAEKSNKGDSMDYYADDETSDDEQTTLTEGQIAALVTATLVAFAKLADKLRELAGADRITYEEAMEYFIDHKNDSPTIVKGAIIKEGAENGFTVFQVFLDKNNQLVTDSIGNPLGYRKKVTHMDNELLNVFKGKDLVIVE